MNGKGWWWVGHEGVGRENCKTEILFDITLIFGLRQTETGQLVHLVNKGY